MQKTTSAIDILFTSKIIKENIICEFKDLKCYIAENNIHTAVQCLRDWTSRHINVCCPEKKITIKNLESSYSSFINLQAGVWCGGAAYFHSLILRLFNIYSINFGYAYPGLQNLSHAVTIYAAQSSSTIHFYISDAYFNHCFQCNATGEPLNLKELFQRILNNDYSSIRASNLPATRHCIVSPGYDPNDLWFFPQEKRVEPIIKPDRWIYPNALLTPQGMTTLVPFWKNNIESLRGSLSSDEFMYALMLYNHQFGSFGNQHIDNQFKKLLGYINDCLKKKGNFFQEINSAHQNNES